MDEKFVIVDAWPVDLTSSAYLAIALVPALGAVPDESVTRLMAPASTDPRAPDQASAFETVE
jgi:hypothetical protein